MVNGDNLKGNLSSVQACIIVPEPGNDSIYYLFTTDAVENSFANGYTYSIINLNKDNGNGEVITKMCCYGPPVLKEWWPQDMRMEQMYG